MANVKPQETVDVKDQKADFNNMNDGVGSGLGIKTSSS